MNKYLRIAIVTIITLYISNQNGSAQDFSSEIPNKLKKLEAEKLNQSGEVVINTKMIEKFYRIYNEVEVISWRQMLNERGYDSTLIYMQAYQCMNLEEVDVSNLNTELEKTVQNRAYELEQEIFRNHPITSVDTPGVDREVELSKTL